LTEGVVDLGGKEAESRGDAEGASESGSEARPSSEFKLGLGIKDIGDLVSGDAGDNSSEEFRYKLWVVGG
jgi:hypothetical protein